MVLMSRSGLDYRTGNRHNNIATLSDSQLTSRIINVAVCQQRGWNTTFSRERLAPSASLLIIHDNVHCNVGVFRL